MDKSINLHKTSYNKNDYDKVVDRTFSFFPDTQLALEVTVDEFFNIYEDLYLEIPVEGDINSHTYLVQKSNELVNLDRNTEEIQPLLDEIAQLRQQLLEANQQILTLQQNAITYGQ